MLPFIHRAALATLALLPVIWIASRGGGGGSLEEPATEGVFLAACLIGAVLNIAMFEAFLSPTVAVALICFYTFPAIVTVAAVPLYGERIDRIRASAFSCLVSA